MSLTIWMELLLLSMVRIVVFFAFLPFFSKKRDLRGVMLALGVSLAWGTVPYRMEQFQTINTMPEYLLAVVGEVAVGWVMAYSVQVVVAAVSMAGTLIDTEIGLSVGQLFDPSTGKANSFISTLYNYLFLIVFLQMKGLNLIIEGLMYSFNKVDYQLFFGEKAFLVLMIEITSSMLLLAMQLALPFMLCMFILNVLLLILHRTAPQINILSNMFVFKISIGLILLYCMMPYVGQAFSIVTEKLVEIQYETIRYLTK